MTRTVSSASGKVAACVLVLALVVIGTLGLVLPIIPGLLLLAIAVFIAARHFPSVDARLRRHRVIDKHLSAAERIRHLSVPAQIRVAGWLCLKALAEGLALVAALAAKIGQKPRPFSR